MKSEGNQNLVIIIRPHPKSGGGQADVFYLDSNGGERLVFQIDYSGNQNWSKDLIPVFQDSFEKGITKAIIDLIDVKWINSTGLGTLMSLYNILEKAGGKVVLASPSSKVASILKVTKLDRHFWIGNSFDEAVEYLSSKGGHSST